MPIVVLLLRLHDMLNHRVNCEAIKTIAFVIFLYRFTSFLRAIMSIFVFVLVASTLYEIILKYHEENRDESNNLPSTSTGHGESKPSAVNGNKERDHILDTSLHHTKSYSTTNLTGTINNKQNNIYYHLIIKRHLMENLKILYTYLLTD